MSLERNYAAFDASSVPVAVRHAANLLRSKSDGDRCRGQDTPTEPWHSVCTSTAWLQLLESAARYARTNDPISIVGEIGTGKRYVAERVCALRCVKHLKRISCGRLATELSTGCEQTLGEWKATVNETLFLGDSTWWLDGVDDLPICYQSLVLELLNEILASNASNLPIVCTSKLSLFELYEAGRIREDLYYALSVHELNLPPLRERPSDILSLTTYFATAPNAGLPSIQFSRQASELLANHDWPGNTKQLRSVVSRVRVLADRTVIDSDQLLGIWKQRKQPTADLSTLSLEEAETKLILQAVERAGGNKTAAAKQLGITARTLHNKMQKYRSLGLLDASANASKSARS